MQDISAYTRLDWFAIANELEPFFQPLENCTTSEECRETIKTALMTLMDVENPRSNPEIYRALNDFRADAKNVLTPRHYKRIVKHAELFNNPNKSARLQDARTATFIYLLKNRGYRYLRLLHRNPEKFERVIADQQLPAVNDYMSSPEVKDRIKQKNIESIQRQINYYKQQLLSPRNLQHVQQSIENDERDLERCEQAYEAANQRLVPQIDRHELFQQYPIIKTYLRRRVNGESHKQAVWRMRGHADELQEALSHFPELTNATEEQLTANHILATQGPSYNELNRIGSTYERIEQDLDKNRGKLLAHNAAEEALIPLQRQLHQVETNGPDIGELSEISTLEYLRDQFNRDLPQREASRILHREEQINEINQEIARSPEELDELRDKAPEIARSDMTIEDYRDSKPTDTAKMDTFITSIEPNKQISISGFTNKERAELLPRLISKLDDIFKTINATDTVQIRFGRGKDVKFAPSIRTQAGALEFLKKWTQNGFVINYDEDTHIPLTAGDRESVAPMYLCDWFEIVVHHGKSAPGGGYPKWYYKRTNSPVVINGQEYNEETLIKALERYQIPDHILTAADNNSTFTEPCFIHVISLLDYTPRQLTQVRDLLFSRLKYIHLPATDAAIILEELNVKAIFHDYDNDKTFTYSAHGVRYDDNDEHKNCSKEGLYFGHKKCKNGPRCNHKDCSLKYFTKCVDIDILDKHYMIHDENVQPFNMSSIELIRLLIHDKKIIPFSVYDISIYTKPLKPRPISNLATYSHTCFKTPSQVISYYNCYKTHNIKHIRSLRFDDPKLATFTNDNPELSGLIGYYLLLNYMKDKNLNILADGGTVKQFLSQSTRGAMVAIENNKMQIVHESVSYLDINSFYWFCLRNIDVGTGYPKTIPTTFTLENIVKLARDGAIVFLQCTYRYKSRHSLDRPPKRNLVLTTYDILSGSFEIDDSEPMCGYYWSADKVLKQPFKQFVDTLYQLKYVNPQIKRIVNAGIGMLVHKWKSRYIRPGSTLEPTNLGFIASIDNGKKQLWANAVDYEYNFTQIHSLIVSYASYYLQTVLFKHCQEHNIRTIYTSTDSIVVPTADISKLESFMENPQQHQLGKLKIEAQSNATTYFIRKGLYYISDDKYAKLNVPDSCIRNYCSRHGMSLHQFYSKIANGETLILSDEFRRYTLSVSTFSDDLGVDN